MGGKVAPDHMVTSFAIPIELREWLEHESRERGLTFSEVMRRAVALYRSMPTSVRMATTDPLVRKENPGEAGERTEAPTPAATGPPPA